MRVAIGAGLKDGAFVRVVISIKSVMRRGIELRICPDRDFAVVLMLFVQISAKNNGAMHKYARIMPAFRWASMLALPCFFKRSENKPAWCQHNANGVAELGKVVCRMGDQACEQIEGVGMGRIHDGD